MFQSIMKTIYIRPSHNLLNHSHSTTLRHLGTPSNSFSVLILVAGYQLNRRNSRRRKPYLHTRHSQTHSRSHSFIYVYHSRRLGDDNRKTLTPSRRKCTDIVRTSRALFESLGSRQRYTGIDRSRFALLRSSPKNPKPLESPRTFIVRIRSFVRSIGFSISTRTFLQESATQSKVEYSRIKKQARMALETHFSNLSFV
ncbi:hypothetical protein Hdeb2414_s0006g00221841 [Helianthus debilis subsp. tardiflorus]